MPTLRARLLFPFGLVAVVPAQQWQLQAPNFSPSAVAAYDGGRERVVVYDEGIGADGAMVAFDGQRFALVPTATAPRVHLGQLAWHDAARKLVLFGGGSTAATWEWDGADWRQRFPVHQPPARGYHAMAYHAATQRVLLFGGDQPNSSTLRDDTWEWDGNDWTQRVGAGPAPRMGAAMAYDVQRQRTVLFGGFDRNGVLADTWEWDGNAWQQRQLAGPPASYTSLLTYDESQARMLLYRGNVGAGGLWQYDGTTWTALPQTTPWYGSAFTYHPPTRQTLLVGGPTWLFSLSGWSQPDLPTPKADSAVMAFDSARGVVVCCQPDLPANPNETTEWAGAGWQRRPTGSKPPGERWSGVYDSGRGETLLFGGEGASGTWAWNGSQWTLRATAAASPPARMHEAIGYDPVRQRVVVYGGNATVAGPILGDTWEWDGQAGTWTQRTPAVTPGLRYGASMAFHPGLGKLVLAGGVLASTQMTAADTWTFDGSNWVQLATPASPPPHERRPLLWHSGRQRLLLIAAGYPGTDWEFDGVTWTLAANGTPPQYVVAAAYDPLRDVVLAHATGGVFELGASPAGIQAYGTDCGGAQAPLLGTFGLPQPGNLGFRIDVQLPGIGARPVLFVGGLGTASVPAPGGCTLLVQPSFTGVQVTGFHGFASQPVPVPPSAALRGLVLHWQAAAATAAPGGFVASRGLTTTVGD